jgi:hypothetical protein
MAVRGVVLLAALVVGCGRASERQQEFERLLGAGTFVRIAATTVGGDRIDVWHERTGEEWFGPFLIVARDEAGRLIDFRRGRFTSSNRPYFQDDRYCVLVGHAESSAADMFFVYDSRAKRFLARGVPHHVHDGFVVVGDRILFSSCKTPEPVWLLDLKSGRDISLGREAPQGADFAVEGSAVFVLGDGKVFELAGQTMAPSRRRPRGAPHATGGFEQIRVRIPSGS